MAAIGTALATAQTGRVFSVINVIPMEGIWRYNASGTNPPTAWRTNGFDDLAWGSRYAPFQSAGVTIPALTNTVLPLTNASGESVITYYFRTRFKLPPPLSRATVASLVVTGYVDDGVIFYLNGVEAARFNMPAGDVTSTTLAATARGNPAEPVTIPLSMDALVTGENLLVAEVHQATTNDTDFAFAASVWREIPYNERAVITNQPASVVVAAGGAARFTAGVTGTNLRFQWYHDSTPIPEATNTVFDLTTVAAADAGIYRFIATGPVNRAISADAALLLADPTANGLDRIGAGNTWTSDKPGVVTSFDAREASGAWGVPGSVFVVATNVQARDFSFVFFGRKHNLGGSDSGPLTTFEDYALSLWVWTNGVSGFTSNPRLPDLKFDVGNGPTNPVAFGSTTNWMNGQAFPTFRHTVDLRAFGFRLEAGRQYVIAPVFLKDDAERLVRLSLSSVAGPEDAYAGFQGATGMLSTAGIRLRRYATALTVETGSPPQITAAPASVTLSLGGAATFTVAANGPGPLFYQWLRGGVALPGATNATLALANLQAGDVGLYAVRVTNADGSTTSAPAVLSAVRLDLDEQRRGLLSVWGPAPTTYSVKHKASLDPNVVWQSLTNFILINSPHLFLDLTSSNVPVRFYQVAPASP